MQPDFHHGLLSLGMPPRSVSCGFDEWGQRQSPGGLVQNELEAADMATIDDAGAWCIVGGRMLDLLSTGRTLPRHKVESEILPDLVTGNGGTRR